MSSIFRTQQPSEDRGAYTTVAQADEVMADPENGDVPSSQQLGPPLHIGSVPTPEDHLFLPRVADSLPRGAFLVAIVELCERFAYYGFSGPFQNYIANSYHDDNGLPGALGLKQSGATAMTNFFQMWCYVTPTMGAIVADEWLGKYATIKWFSLVYMAGIIVLFVTSLPRSIEAGYAFPGLVVAMLVIGLGTGGIKSNVSPMIAEQVRSSKPFVKVQKNGEQVIIDPELTVQRIYMVFYMCINVGAISAIFTTTLESRIGFWAAYLLPLAMFAIGYAVLVGGKKNYVIKPSQGGVIGHAFRALWIAVRNGGDLDKARPAQQRHLRGKWQVTWDGKFIDELKTALVACKVFLFFPIYWVGFSQMMNNFVSQAGQMQLHGLPNDIFPNIDPIALIFLIPLVDRIIYPFIRTRLHFAFTPITRIALGFFFAALAMLYAGALQMKIYGAPPCYFYPLKCAAADSNNTTAHMPNEVHVAWQAPAYILVAISEILASITGLELAYAKAPENMKSFIMSLFLLTSAGGSALGILVAPFAKDPYLQWLYFGLASVIAATGWVFYRMFGNLDDGKADAGGEEYELAERRSEDDDGYYSGVDEEGRRRDREV